MSQHWQAAGRRARRRRRGRTRLMAFSMLALGMLHSLAFSKAAARVLLTVGSAPPATWFCFRFGIPRPPAAWTAQAQPGQGGQVRVPVRARAGLDNARPCAPLTAATISLATLVKAWLRRWSLTALSRFTWLQRLWPAQRTGMSSAAAEAGPSATVTRRSMHVGSCRAARRAAPSWTRCQPPRHHTAMVSQTPPAHVRHTPRRSRPC